MLLLSFKKIWLKQRKRALRGSSLSSQLLKLFVVLFIVLALHIAAMIQFERLSLGDAVWLTVTSATTVGYGDISAQTFFGRMATIVLIYIGGIAILAQVAAMYFEQRQEVRERMLRGDWSWVMQNHIVFLNCPDEVSEDYFYQAISGLRQSNAESADLPIVIVCERFKDGISDRLRKLDVVLVSRPVFDPETLGSASVQDAHTIVIFAKDQLDPLSDSVNFELVDRIREMTSSGCIIVEAINDNNRERLKKAGADHVLRPIHTYPELLMRTIVAPGSEQVIETLFNSDGEECIRYEVSFSGAWLDIVHELISRDLGIPIAYQDKHGDIVNSPSAKQQVETQAIFVIVNEGHIKLSEEIEQVLKAKL